MTKQSATAFAPSNIALCKYWGKRDEKRNLPLTSSLSISLGQYGTTTTLAFSDSMQDEVYCAGERMDDKSEFVKRVTAFLDCVREKGQAFEVRTENNLPTAAGLATSASAFAALTLAANDVLDWQYDKKRLSQIARLGSGSASRSLWQGFVEWHSGHRADGEDCFAERLPVEWPEFCVGLLIINAARKAISSREAMNRTRDTSPQYQQWPRQVETDLRALKEALSSGDFHSLGEVAERNAEAMHTLMQTAKPPIHYSQAETHALKQRVWQLRKQGVGIYFTQDAGPNLKVLFLVQDLKVIQNTFPEMIVIQPFGGNNG